MFKKKVIPKCPVCGSQDVSPDLLMQCNCTKGMGRSLSYPRFRCCKCHASFGDRKNRRIKDTVGVKYEFIDPSGASYLYTIQTSEHDADYILKENGKIIAEGALTNRQWKRFLENFYDLYPLEWLNYDGEASELKNTFDNSNAKKFRWLLEIEFKDDSTEIRKGSGEMPPYSEYLTELVNRTSKIIAFNLSSDI